MRSGAVAKASLPGLEGSAERTKPTVVFVLGAHRSGSTILGVTLGNCEKIFFAGEVHSWFARRGMPSFCDEQGEDLWRSIRRSVNRPSDLFGDETQLYIDRTSALYRVNRWPLRRRLRPRYAQLNEELYRAIATVTGSSFIVDTSHYPLRARELQRMGGIDLYILFLVRDAQGIVASLDPRDESSGSKSAVTANLHLLSTYLLSAAIFLRQPASRRLFVRHEDFLANPESVLGQILAWIGSPSPLPDFAALDAGSPLQGNRFLRGTGPVALRRKPARPARASLMTSAMQLPLAPLLARMRPAVRAEEEEAAESGETRVSA